MANVEIVKVDQGGANARILAREAKVDFVASRRPASRSPRGSAVPRAKRMFVRMFNTLQLNMHFISVIARTRLDHEDIGRIETALRGRIDAATASLNEAIDGAEALFKAHGITSLASYDTVPLDVDVRVLSSISRRFLEVLVKLDQLMPLLQTLEIHEGGVGAGGGHAACGPQAPGARHRQWCAQLCDGLRRRMNALDARAVSPDDAEGPDDAHGAAIGEVVDSTTRAPDGPADPPPSAGLAWSCCLRRRQSLRWQSRRWNCGPSDVSPKRRNLPTLARAIGAGVLPRERCGRYRVSGHGLPAEAHRRHRSADHPFNGRIARPPPASGGVAVDTCLVQRRHAAFRRAGQFRRTRRARLGDRTHPVPDSALRGIERADPHRMAVGMHPRGGDRITPKGPSAGALFGGIFIHRANGTPAVVQESSVPGRLARF